MRRGAGFTAAYILSLTAAGLMLTVSVLGLVIHGLYPEETWAVAALRGNDLVTLVLVVPVLAWVAIRTRRHASGRSTAIWLGLLFYGVYNYAYYVFGTAFNDVFLLHVAALVTSLAALVLLVTRIDARTVAGELAGGRRARVVAAFSVLVGVALVAAWGGLSLRYAVTGELPEGVMPPDAVHLVYALDLSLLVPAFLASGVLLWRRYDWGPALTAAVNVFGTAYLTALWVVGGFQANAGIDEQTWLSPVGLASPALCLAAALCLLVPTRRG